jgi:thioredoxin
MATETQFSNFDELLACSDLPVLVDFYATWCGPCKMMEPELEQVSVKLEGKLKVVKVDTEKYPALASRYSVQSLPTLAVFKDGQLQERFEGVLRASQIILRLQDYLDY